MNIRIPVQGRAPWLLLATLVATSCFNPDPDPAGGGTGSGADGSDTGGTTTDGDDGTTGSATGDHGTSAGSGSHSGSGSGGTTDAGTTGGAGSSTGGSSATTDGASGGHTTGTEETCAGSCVPVLPGGWNGPIAMFVGAFGDASPTCSGEFPVGSLSLVGSPDEGLHECECACEVQDAACEELVVGRWTEEGCDGVFNEGMRDWDGVVDRACEFLPGDLPIGEAWKLGINDPPGVTGSCQKVDEDHIDDVSWAERFVGCEPAAPPVQLDCSPGRVCVPTPEAPFAKSHCIYAPGANVPCPSGSYEYAGTFFQSATDTRTCSACGSCQGSPSGTCEGTVEIYVSECPETGFPAGQLTLGSSLCDEFGTNHSDDLAVVADIAPSASCSPPTGGEPQGTVAYEGPITVCCS